MLASAKRFSLGARWAGEHIALIAGAQIALISVAGLVLLTMYCIGGGGANSPLESDTILSLGILDSLAAQAETAPGGYLLFAASDVAGWSVYVSDVEGENRELLRSGIANVPVGGFSPAGQWLFFVAEDDSESTLCVAEADGTDLREVLSVSEALAEKVTFSSDGWVLVVGFHPQHKGQGTPSGYVYNRRADIVTDLTGYYVQALSSDGRWALLGDCVTDQGIQRFVGSFDLLNTETGHRESLGEFGEYSEAYLAPDGSHVVIASYDPLRTDSRVQIYQVDQARWSWHYYSSHWMHVSRFFPDGQHFLLTKDGDSYLVDARTGELGFYLSGRSRVGLEGFPGFPEQVPQTEDKVLINVQQRDSFSAFLANADGTGLRPVAEGAIGVLFGDESHVLLMHFQGWDAEVPISGYSVLDLRSGNRQEFSSLVAGSPDSYATLRFSPGGTQILIHEYRQDTSARAPRFEVRLWVFDTASMRLRQLGSAESAWWNWGAFSSDGSRILYNEMWSVEGPTASLLHLYAVDAGGSNPRLIAENAVPLNSW